MADSNSRGADWRSIVLVIFAIGGVILAFSSAIGVIVFMAFDQNRFMELNGSALTSILTASTLIAVGLLLLPAAWLSVKRLRGEDFNPFVLPPLRLWEWVAIPAFWFLSLTLATLFHDAPGAKWYIPFLHFFSIALPIYIIFRVAVSRISLGSSQRVWGVFGIGMVLSPLLAIVAEFTVIAIGVLIVALYLGFNPDQLASIERLINLFQQTTDMDRLLTQAGPLLKNPLTLLVGLMFLSFFVPIIEETAKSLGVWFVADRLRFPAQGFALGVLSGAGFALTESLSASLTPDDGWALTLSVRAISGAMHMLAAGLLGWGIAYARLEKRYLRLVGMMLLAMFLHSAWNAGAVFSVWGGVRVMLAMPGIDFLGAIIAFGGMGLLIILIAGMFFAFFVLNDRLRASVPPPELPAQGIEESGTENV